MALLNSSSVVLIIGCLLILVAVGLWAYGLRQQTGLPAGGVIYTDTGTWFPQKDALYANDLFLVGKPDYLVQQTDGNLIPVEIKSGRAPEEPWEGHVLQLAAYCLLVQENYGIRPLYGILQYKDKAFAIDYTDEMEEDLLDLLAEMRESQFDGELDRDHNDWRRCAGCGLRGDCEQRLA